MLSVIPSLCFLYPLSRIQFYVTLFFQAYPILRIYIILPFPHYNTLKTTFSFNLALFRIRVIVLVLVFEIGKSEIVHIVLVH